MASLDRAEGDLFEGVGLIVLLALVGLGILAYMAAKKISFKIPAGLYPWSIFSNASTWIDESFQRLPDRTKAFTDPIQQSVDEWLATPGAWILDHTPQPPAGS
jgi:hypothetical protein